MKNIVAITFRRKNRKYYFDAEELKLERGDQVVVQTEKGLELGTVDSLNIGLKNEAEILGIVIRTATKKDQKNYDKNLQDEKKAIKKCRELAETNHLNMYIVDANFTLEREQLLFRFLSDSRIDFRNLARELASIYHTRIELRQIGVRDKAKEVGGLGYCGRPLCCSKFLQDFDSVSINMAKNQNIALNPSKINGACGRLLCCLKYEDEIYKEARKNCPKLGEKVKTKDGEGKVTNLDLLKQTYQVEIPKVGKVEVAVSNEKS